MKELSNFREFLNEEEQVKEGYTPNEDEMKDAQAYIRLVSDYIKLAENYIKGQYDQEEMNITSLIDGLDEILNDMRFNFPSYNG